jgi:hypothetical protein
MDPHALSSEDQRWRATEAALSRDPMCARKVKNPQAL